MFFQCHALSPESLSAAQCVIERKKDARLAPVAVRLGIRIVIRACSDARHRGTALNVSANALDDNEGSHRPRGQGLSCIPQCLGPPTSHASSRPRTPPASRSMTCAVREVDVLAEPDVLNACGGAGIMMPWDNGDQLVGPT